MKKIKILIVDDEIIYANSLSIELKGLGYEICTIATKGEKAIKIAENEKPDIVLMDIGLPGKMDGIKTASIIKDLFRIPVIYLTGYSDKQFMAKAEIAEQHEYLIKPILEIDIKNAIDLVFQKQKMKK